MLNYRKQKSQLISLNSTFKVIKNSLDEVKAMIQDVHETKKIKAKMHDAMKSLIGKMPYLTFFYRKGIYHHKQKL